MPPKFKDKDTQFLEKLIPKLKRDILSQMVGVNFGSPREKQKFIKAVSDLMHEYSKEIGDKTEKELTEAWNFEKESVELFTQNISFGRLPTKQTLDFLLSLNDIISGTKTELDNLFDTSITSFVRTLNFAEGRIRNEILAEIASGSLSGKPFSEISRRLTELFEKEGIPGFTITDKNGNNINYTLESRANRLVSHAIITSRQKAVVMEAVKNGIDLIKISKHGDESPMCKPHSGKIYSITGLTEGYPLLETALWKGGFKKGDGVGHPYCLTDRNKILTSKGALPISEVRNGAAVLKPTGGLAKITSKVIIDYTGNIYTISGTDFEMSGTPDHSCFSELGFLPFEEMRVGDKLIDNKFNIVKISVNSIIHNPNNSKTFFDKFFISNKVFFKALTANVFSAVNFNNKITTNEITNISVNNLLKIKNDTSLFHPFKDPRFVLCGFRFQDFAKAFTSFSSDFSSVHITTTVNEMLSSLPSRNTQLFHRIFDRSGGFVATDWSDLFSTHIFIIIDISQELEGIAVQFFNLFYGIRRHITKCKVLPTSCQVYDIEVEGGQYLLENNIISHNCRHTFMAHIPTNIEFVVEYTKYGSQRGKMQSSEMTQKEKKEIQKTIEKRQEEIEELKQKRAEQSKNFTKADWDKYGKSLSGDISSIEIL